MGECENVLPVNLSFSQYLDQAMSSSKSFLFIVKHDIE